MGFIGHDHELEEEELWDPAASPAPVEAPAQPAPQEVPA